MMMGGHLCTGQQAMATSLWCSIYMNTALHMTKNRDGYADDSDHSDEDEDEHVRQVERETKGRRAVASYLRMSETGG
jgi:hypothetical protein